MCPNHSFQVEKMPKNLPKNKKKTHTHTLSLSPRAPLILPRAFFLLQLETKTQDYKELKPIAPPHTRPPCPPPKKWTQELKKKQLYVEREGHQNYMELLGDGEKNKLGHLIGEKKKKKNFRGLNQQKKKNTHTHTRDFLDLTRSN